MLPETPTANVPLLDSDGDSIGWKLRESVISAAGADSLVAESAKSVSRRSRQSGNPFGVGRLSRIHQRPQISASECMIGGMVGRPCHDVGCKREAAQPRSRRGDRAVQSANGTDRVGNKRKSTRDPRRKKRLAHRVDLNEGPVHWRYLDGQPGDGPVSAALDVSITPLVPLG